MHYHIIGIGGSSLSGIAELLRSEGHTVTGTDARTTGHGPEKLPASLDAVIYSEAVTPDSAGWAELMAARNRGIQTLRRIEYIAERMHGKTGIAIAGAHGKSTTTALIGWLFTQAGTDPTVFVGADVPAFGSSARSGRGQYVIAEACEWNKQFLALNPDVLVVTSIDREHLDTFPGGEQEIIVNFRQLAAQLRPAGFIVANADDPLVRTALADHPAQIYWVGRSASASYRITAIDQAKEGQLAVGLLTSVRGAEELTVPLAGDHQAVNAAIAFCVANELGLDRSTLVAALTSFPGLKRRFEYHQNMDDRVVIDDYAHHPAELLATLRAARDRYPNRRLVAVFQPHLSERTTDLFAQFVDALSLADLVVIPETYEPAGRHRRPDAKTSDDLVAALLARDIKAEASGTIAATCERLPSLLQTGDVVLTLGATDVWRVAESLAPHHR